MKRNLFTIMLAFLVVFGVNAQKSLLNSKSLMDGLNADKPSNVIKMQTRPYVADKGNILDEGFETWPPAGWGFFQLGDPAGWVTGTTAHTGLAGAFHDDDNVDSNCQDWMMTPSLAITNDQFYVKYWEYQLYETYYVLHRVVVFDGPDPSTATELEELATGVGTEDTWVEKSFSLSAYDGQTIYIGFYYEGDYADEWSIDDVTVGFLDPHDLGVTVVTPAGFIETGSTIAPTVTIKNFGSSDEATYDVQLVSTPAGYDETVSDVAITAGQVLELNGFPTWAPADGNYTLTATVTLTDDANAGNDQASSDIEVRPIGFGDVVSSFDATTSAQVGIETDGNNIYLSLWNDDAISKYDMDGTFVEDITISGVSAVRDMAYNPTTGYFYGAAANTSLFEMDLANATPTLVSTITAATDCRAIAYDDRDNTFWANNWGSDLTEFDMTGAATGNSMAVPSIYGAAYDKWSDPANPTLWLFRGTGGDTETSLVEFAMDGTATGRSIDVSAFPGFTETVGSGAGGLATYEEDGIAYFLVNVQLDPNKVYKVYLAEVPSASTETDILTYSFAEQTGDATIDATAHTVAIEVANGTDLTDLTATFTLSTGATANIGGTAQVSGTTSNDFTSAVTYNVVAEDGSTNQDWEVTVTVAAGINELNAGISVYPNPSNGTFTVNVENDFNLEVLDITGKVINTQVLNGSNIVKIDNAGVYFLRFSNNEGSVTQKVIVQ